MNGIRMRIKNHLQMIVRVIIFAGVFVNYATCRTAKEYREMPEAAVRLSQAQFPSYNLAAPDGPGTYAFGYEIEDIVTGNIQFRDEEKLRNGTVKGSYGVLLPDDTLHIARYISDHLGYRTTQETRKRNDNGPLKLEVQVQPSVKPATTSTNSLTGEQIGIATSTSTYEPFETRNPFIDPAVAGAIYQQHQINLRPTFGPLRDQNILDPNVVNALLNQQLLHPADGGSVFRQQNFDEIVSPYARQTSSTSRPPLFSWPGTNFNDQQQQQQGPVIGFLSNLVQNNPLTNFLNTINPQQQQQQQQQQPNTPILNLLSNLNPLNLFTNNNNNRPSAQITLPSLSIQSDYVMSPTPNGQVVVMPPTSPSSSILASNIDSSVFSNGVGLNNDHFLNPHTINTYPPGLVPGLGPVPSSFNYPTISTGYGGNPYAPPSHSSNSYLNQFSTTSRPFQTYPGVSGNILPYSYLYNGNNNHQIPSLYPSTVYRNPYQPTNSISPIISLNPLTASYYNNHRRKTSKKSNKKNNKNKVEIGETGSDWFNDFLDRRKEASLDVTSTKRPPNKIKDSDEDDDDIEDYFR